MPDNGKKGAAGQRVRIPADVFNNMLDMSEAWQAGRSLSQPTINTGPNQRVLVHNNSGDVIEWYGIVGVDGPLIDPDVNEAGFLNTPGFRSDDPAAGAPFAILQDAALPDTIVPAVMSGESAALVLINDVTDTFAGPITNDYEKLSSTGLATTCDILWANLPAATQLNGAINDAVTTLVVDSSRGYRLTPFTVTIGSEDLTVTNVAGLSWTVTRGANGTTAASHADNAAVTFKSGVVWAMVRLGSSAAEDDNLPEIMTLDMLHLW